VLSDGGTGDGPHRSGRAGPPGGTARRGRRRPRRAVPHGRPAAGCRKRSV